MQISKIIILVNIIVSLYAGNSMFLFNCIKICSESRVLYYLQNNPSLINATDQHKDSMLHYAVRYKKYRVIAYLVNHGADVSLIGANHQTPVDIAIENNDTVAMKYLMTSRTFSRVAGENKVQNFLKQDKELFELYEDNFIDDDEFESFQEEMHDFSKRVREKSMYDKKHKVYMRSRSVVNKSHNVGNADITIK